MAQTESGYSRKKSQFVPLKPKRNPLSKLTITCENSDKYKTPKNGFCNSKFILINKIQI